MYRWGVAVPGALIALGMLLVLVVLTWTFGRPPQPLPLGTIQWLGEVGITVDRVDRVGEIIAGDRKARARGEFYIVHARILAPFGLRPTWNDRDAVVETFAGSGGTMHGLRFAIDEHAQALLDARTGRPGPTHVVRGAVLHEDVVFDLPRNVEQPGIVFLRANDPMGLLNLAFGRVWQPHRFNLRYD